MLQKLTVESDRRQTRERRQSERLDASGAAVSIAHESGVGGALCGDVSRSGARLSLDRPLAVGEIVSIAFGAQTTLTGRVAWVDQAECGIEFDEAIPQKLRGQPVARGDRRRATSTKIPAPRFQAGLKVTVMLPGCERKAVLHWTDDNSANITMQP